MPLVVNVWLGEPGAAPFLRMSSAIFLLVAKSAHLTLLTVGICILFSKLDKLLWFMGLLYALVTTLTTVDWLKAVIFGKTNSLKPEDGEVETTTTTAGEVVPARSKGRFVFFQFRVFCPPGTCAALALHTAIACGALYPILLWSELLFLSDAPFPSEVWRPVVGLALIFASWDLLFAYAVVTLTFFTRLLDDIECILDFENRKFAATVTVLQHLGFIFWICFDCQVMWVDTPRQGPATTSSPPRPVPQFVGVGQLSNLTVCDPPEKA